MIFKASVLGKLRGDLVGGAVLRLELVPDLGRPGVHRQQRLRAAAAPLEPRRRGAVLPRLAGRHDVHAAARRHAPVGDDGPVAGRSPRSAITMITALLYNAGRIGECTVTPDAYWTVRGRCVSKLDALYLSTITRSTGLLLGAAFAMVWRPRAIMRSPMRDRAGLLDLVALVGLRRDRAPVLVPRRGHRRRVPTRGCSAAASSSPSWRR